MMCLAQNGVLIDPGLFETRFQLKHIIVARHRLVEVLQDRINIAQSKVIGRLGWVMVYGRMENYCSICRVPGLVEDGAHVQKGNITVLPEICKQNLSK